MLAPLLISSLLCPGAYNAHLSHLPLENLWSLLARSLRCTTFGSMFSPFQQQWSLFYWNRNGVVFDRAAQPRSEMQDIPAGRYLLQMHPLLLGHGWRNGAFAYLQGKWERACWLCAVQSSNLLARPRPFNWGFQISFQKLCLSSVHPMSC